MKALSRPFFLFAAAGKKGKRKHIKADIEALLKLWFLPLSSVALSY